MKTILVATDLTTSSSQALDWARLLARHYKAALTLTHIYTMPTPPVSGAPLGLADTASTVEMTSDLEAISREQVDKLANQLCSEGFTVQTDWRIGPIGDEIRTAAEEHNADLIITGRSDMSSFFDRLIGTSATSVAEKASCPVLVVPAVAENQSAAVQLRTIVFASPLETNDTTPFRSVLDMARQFGAVLHLLTVHAENQPNLYSDQDALAELNQAAEGTSFRKHTVEARTVTDGIHKYLEEHPADLLVMTSRERGFLDGLLNPSLTGKILSTSMIPVLVYHS
jgi:nucleotide-binding universal stress UspA family protein